MNLLETLAILRRKNEKSWWIQNGNGTYTKRKKIVKKIKERNKEKKRRNEIKHKNK